MNRPLVRFVANQFGLGNDIAPALAEVENRVAETKVSVVIGGDKRLQDGLEKNLQL